jgi:dTDP-4-dehydrorhamnose 3,5-epimerase
LIEAAQKDQQSTNAEWDLPAPKIAGLLSREVKHLPTRSGITTEVYRQEWAPHDEGLVHIISVAAQPGSISAWHLHKKQTDHFFLQHGALLFAAFDDRPESSSYRQLDVFRLNHVRPRLLVIPPGVWHGFRSISHETSFIINAFDVAYKYADPDEWRLPADTTHIPFSFG